MSASPITAGATLSARSRTLQLLGILSGLTAGAWLGAAEAPTKLVTLGLSPMVISLVMVIGVFLARWSLPALILGSSSISADARRAPHLIVWAILAGCLWAVANTLTVYAIRDIGLSIAFPLWNSNSLLGILWGFLFFNELRGAGLSRWLGVLGGTLVMCIGAAILAIASSGAHTPGANPAHGILAALGAGVLWGTMYIPYRKAYLSGMNPLSFVTFFTIGELGMMSTLSFGTLGSQYLFAQLSAARGVIFWLMLGGFIWVIGDLFQQYAAKYVGISRGIPLSNTNQLWGLLWGVLVFGELHGRSTITYTQVIGGSLLMILGVAAIALASASPKESAQWKAAALRESDRYGLSPDFVEARMDGRQSIGETAPSRGIIDWIFVAVATAVFVYFASIARVPNIPAHWTPAIFLSIASLILLAVCGLRLWRTTRFQ
ncbi:MAG: EamA family transporter [Acidobacteria bacterium]|nr:EamA family transporter [Acidobacteriota bacterium]MBS1865228.1 EamA family transporter [Acidobacteriota bacterium]